MQLKKEILEELGQLSMVIAGIPRQMPYEIPEGYFEAFPEKMLHLLTEPADTKDEVLNPGWGKEPVFSVPDGYFEGFAARMMDRIKAGTTGMRQGEQAISSPTPAAMEAREELAGLSPLLSRIDKKMPYRAPEGYFDALEPAVQEENLSPLMAGLKGMTTYQVPQGYFESLPEIISARVERSKEASPAKVISMSRHRKAWWQYSAAAVVAAFVFTIGWLRLHTPAGKQGLNNADVAQGLARVSDQDIQSYLDNQDNHMAQAQQDDVFGKSIASLDFSDNDIKSFLGDVPDNDLTQYVEEHGDLKDYPTN
ncbi:MAG: hypothetical protein J0H74_02255 [Chitinophagaceae bacterium]|nr:hypothetical protein [Chitinophagaceae bacterium]